MKDETAGDPSSSLSVAVPRIMATNYRMVTQCKVRGFTLDKRGHALLNFESRKQHILAELYDPDEERKTIPIPVNPNFEKDSTTKKICLTEKVKRYGLVFDKRVIKSDDCSSRPYGYDWIRKDIDLLISL